MRHQAGDAEGIEIVAQHIIRNTFLLAKLSYFENTGTVIHRSKMVPVQRPFPTDKQPPGKENAQAYKT